MIEKVALALITLARRLKLYFQSNQVVVKMNYVIKQVLRNPELVGMMVAWFVELSKFDIQYQPRGLMKIQFMDAFLAEFDGNDITTPDWWTLYINGASNVKESGVGIILEGPNNITLEQALKLNFKASNNQTKYKALISGLKLARKVGAKRLQCYIDSQLAQGQVANTYQTKETVLLKYYQIAKSLINNFECFEMYYISRESNTRADLLSKLANTKKIGHLKTIIQEMLQTPTIDAEKIMVREEEEPNWMTDVAPCGACRPWIFFINGFLCFLRSDCSGMEKEKDEWRRHFK